METKVDVYLLPSRRLLFPLGMFMLLQGVELERAEELVEILDPGRYWLGWRETIEQGDTIVYPVSCRDYECVVIVRHGQVSDHAFMKKTWKEIERNREES